MSVGRWQEEEEDGDVPVLFDDSNVQSSLVRYDEVSHSELAEHLSPVGISTVSWRRWRKTHFVTEFHRRALVDRDGGTAGPTSQPENDGEDTGRTSQ